MAEKILNQHIAQKTIADPIYGTRSLPDFAKDIISTRVFGRLHGVLQTSFCNLVYPNMTHTRYAHSLGVFILTHNIRLKSEYFSALLSGQEKKALATYALLHDIGHSPFSHILEPFGIDHKKIGLDIVKDNDELDTVFLKHKIDKDLLLDLMSKKNPLSKIVTGGLLSSDKLDYMVRDTHFSGNADFELRTDDFLRYIYFDPKTKDLYLDQKKETLAQHIVNYYMHLYKNIYLRKAVLIADRMFHKAVQLRLEKEGLKTLPPEIIQMTDAEFYYKWLTSTHNKAVLELSRFYNAERVLHKSAIVVKNRAQSDKERAPEHKDMIVVEDDNLIEKFANYNPHILIRLEREIAKALHIKEEHISVVPNMFGERFKMPSLKLATNRGIVELKEYVPEFAKYIEQQARSIPSLRIAIKESVKPHVLHHSDKVLEIIGGFMHA